MRTSPHPWARLGVRRPAPSGLAPGWRRADRAPRNRAPAPPSSGRGVAQLPEPGVSRCSVAQGASSRRLCHHRIHQPLGKLRARAPEEPRRGQTLEEQLHHPVMQRSPDHGRRAPRPAPPLHRVRWPAAGSPGIDTARVPRAPTRRGVAPHRRRRAPAGPPRARLRTPVRCADPAGSPRCRRSAAAPPPSARSAPPPSATPRRRSGRPGLPPPDCAAHCAARARRGPRGPRAHAGPQRPGPPRGGRRPARAALGARRPTARPAPSGTARRPAPAHSRPTARSPGRHRRSRPPGPGRRDSDPRRGARRRDPHPLRSTVGTPVVRAAGSASGAPPRPAVDAGWPGPEGVPRRALRSRPT